MALDPIRPTFLLGLTATPERSDGGDLLALCPQNLVYRCDLVEGVCRELLSRFHYFGVPDDVDYTNIPWRSTRFDEEPEILLGDDAPREAFEASEIKEAVVHSKRDGLEKRRARVLPIPREQATQGERAAARTPLFQCGGIRGHGASA